MTDYFIRKLLRVAKIMTKTNTQKTEECIQTSQYPPYLYKYRQCNDYAFSMLAEDYLWAAKPNEFLDPIDSLIVLDLKKELSSIIEWLLTHCGELVYFKIKPEGMTTPKGNQSLEKYIEAQKIITPDNKQNSITSVQHRLTIEINKLPWKMREEIKQRLKYFQTAEFENRIKESIQKLLHSTANSLRENLFVSCLTKRKDNQMMWETYALHYSGFAIEYDICSSADRSEHVETIKRLFPVIYEEVPSFPMLEFAKEYFDQELYKREMNKSRWETEFLKYTFYKKAKYKEEEEWRLVANENKIPSLCISGVYMGYKISKENEDKLVKICEKKGIRVFKQTFNPFTGKMNFYEYNTEGRIL